MHVWFSFSRAQLVIERKPDAVTTRMSPLVKVIIRKAAADESLGLVLEPVSSEKACCTYAGGSRSVDGLQQGDIVATIDGQPAKSAAAVEKVFAEAAIGDVVLFIEKIGSRSDKGTKAVLAF